MTEQKRLADYTDPELAQLTNEQMLFLAETELNCMPSDQTDGKEYKALRQVVNDIKNGTYINPFRHTTVAEVYRSEIQAVRSARTITGVLEFINAAGSICFAIAGTVVMIYMANNGAGPQGFAIFMLSLFVSILSYYIVKAAYVSLELLSTICDDIRKIRNLQK